MLRADILFRIFFLQPLQHQLIASGAVAKLGIHTGNGGTAGRYFPADRLIGLPLREHPGHLKPLGKGGQLLHGEQITKKIGNTPPRPAGPKFRGTTGQ